VSEANDEHRKRLGRCEAVAVLCGAAPCGCGAVLCEGDHGARRCVAVLSDQNEECVRVQS